jgi:hypothetical protein
MGIKGLTKLIKKFSTNGIRNIKLSSYEGGIVLVDTSIYMYAYKQKFNNPLIGFINQILILTSNNITPIYIFDGAPPKEKKDLLIHRSNIKQNQINKVDKLNEEFNELNNIYDYMKKNEISSTKDINLSTVNNISLLSDKKNIREYSTNILNNLQSITNIEDKISLIEKDIENYKKNIINLTRQHFNDCKELFVKFGIPYIVAEGEAEKLCSQLSHINTIDNKNKIIGCLSNDSDVLANGGLKLLTNFSSYTSEIIEYDLKIILNDLKLSYDQFIDMCILCGCDYLFDHIKNKHIKIGNIGPINAYKLIQSDNNIETIIKKIEIVKEKKENNEKIDKELKKYSKYILPDDYETTFNYKYVRQLFKEQLSLDKINNIINENKLTKINNPYSIISFIEKQFKPSLNILDKISNYYPEYQNNIINGINKKNKLNKKTNKLNRIEKGQKKITSFFNI